MGPRVERMDMPHLGKFYFLSSKPTIVFRDPAM